MKRAVIYGLCSGLVNSVDYLRDEGVCNVVAWFSNMPAATHPLHLYTYCRFGRERFYGYDEAAYDYVRSFLPIYLDMASRIDVFYELDFHDYINIFNKTFDYYYHLLTSQKVDVAIFSSLPHVGDDFILYLIAKYLGITTITFYQSLFPNKFFYIFDLEDYGYFRDAKQLQPYEHQHIEKKHEKDVFYMRNVKRPRLGFSDLFLHLKYRKLIRFLSRYKRFRTYNRLYRRYANTKINLDEKYVYFPLHLQPEMTTSTLGGKYADQLLAIEHLSQKLPEGWFIYLKENPIQTEFMRGGSFWERIKILKNVKFVPIDMNTHMLIKKAQFVATITGTAGWEAITGGKCALVFGRPWYLQLPGVFQYHDNIDIDEILNYRIDHHELEQHFSRLYQKLATGLVSEDYRPIVPDFTASKNEKLFAAFLQEVLYETPVNASVL